MKKILIGTSALVAAGMIAAPGAMAAEKIKLGLGGFMSQYAGYTNQEGSYEKATSTSYAGFDVKGNTEIYAQGSTKLDNGMTVGAQVQIEGEKQNNGSTVDWSFLYLTSPTFGTLQLGEVGDTASQMLHNAPNAGNASQWAALNSVKEWVVGPAAVNQLHWTFDVEDSAAINYITPSFSGFKAGVTFVPDTAETTALTATGTTATGGTPNYATGGQTSKWGASAAYDATFDGVKIGADIARWSYDNNTTSTSYNASYKDTRFGLNVGVAGFTVGGSYLKHDIKNAATLGGTHGKVYEVGAQYATGPYAVSLSYWKSSVEGTVAATTAANDTVKIWNLGGKYAMGPGVDVKGSIARVDYNDETNTLANNNKGWTAHAGISLSF